MPADSPKRSRRRTLLIALAALCLAALFAWRVVPGPVYWVDLYWTVLLDRGWVSPHEDRYPWTVAVDWAPGDSALVTAGYQPDVLLWEPSNGTLIRRLSGHRTWVQEAVFSPDGARIASVDWDGVIIVWETSSGRILHRLEADRDLFTVAFHPTRQELAAGSYEGTVTTFSLDSGTRIASFRANAGGTLFINYSPDGALLASAGEDATIRLFDATSYDPAATLKGHAKGITSVSFAGDGRRLLSCGDDGTARLWDRTSGRQLRVWQTGARWVNFCAFVGQGGQRFVTGDTNGEVRLWQAASDEPGRVVVVHDDWVQCVRPSRGGDKFASVGKAGMIKIFDLAGDKLLRTMEVAPHVK